MILSADILYILSVHVKDSFSSAFLCSLCGERFSLFLSASAPPHEDYVFQCVLRKISSSLFLCALGRGEPPCSTCFPFAFFRVFRGESLSSSSAALCGERFSLFLCVSAPLREDYVFQCFLQMRMPKDSHLRPLPCEYPSPWHPGNTGQADKVAAHAEGTVVAHVDQAPEQQEPQEGSDIPPVYNLAAKSAHGHSAILPVGDALPLDPLGPDADGLHLFGAMNPFVEIKLHAAAAVPQRQQGDPAEQVPYQDVEIRSSRRLALAVQVGRADETHADNSARALFR